MRVQGRLPLHERPGLLLRAEQDELGITAGLQDRVIQVCSSFCLPFSHACMIMRPEDSEVKSTSSEHLSWCAPLVCLAVSFCVYCAWKRL